MSRRISPLVSNMSNLVSPQFSTTRDGARMTVRGGGDWVIHSITSVDADVCSGMNLESVTHIDYDLRKIGRLDTSGAYILTRALKDRDVQYSVLGTDGQASLIDTALKAQMGTAPPRQRQWFDTLDRLGRGSTRVWKETVATLSFLGHFTTEVAKLALSPQRIRWKSVIAQIEKVGLDAAPIIMTLSFFIGAVIAFMGAELLANFGAQVFMVDLVGITVLREFAVLITAIILAGRSASAFAAQLGAMKMRQEIDAMEVIGLDAYRTLVIPRAFACFVAAPILTFLAMMSGIFGGMLVAWLGPTDITPVLFFSRLQEVVTPNNFWVGIVKAPVFALFIAVIGCRQGMAVEGSVTSLGTRTTASVVQAIFAVIVMDAIFAILFLLMGV